MEKPVRTRRTNHGGRGFVSGSEPRGLRQERADKLAGGSLWGLPTGYDPGKEVTVCPGTWVTLSGYGLEPSHPHGTEASICQPCGQRSRYSHAAPCRLPRESDVK